MKVGSRQRVVIAPDEFGGTMTARTAAAAIAAGWRRARPDDQLTLLPQSDGGPGFVEVLAAAGIGAMVRVPAAGPLGAPVDADLLLDGATAYIESAQVCGLHLLGESGPDPASAWAASSAGLGTLLDAAIEAGARRIVVGLGGSATTDGGRGACEALGGWDRVRDRVADVELIAATDVTNPLLGPDGAAAVFGPQKGADTPTLSRLEARLSEWAEVLERDGPRIRDRAGAGAAGGLGGFLLALGARRRAGAAVIADATDRAAQIGAATLVVTGEGRFDAQTAFGKVVAAVAAEARDAAVPALVIAGQLGVDAAVDGVVAAYSMVEHAGSVERAMADPAAVAAEVAEAVALEWSPTHEQHEWSPTHGGHEWSPTHGGHEWSPTHGQGEGGMRE